MVHMAHKKLTRNVIVQAPAGEGQSFAVFGPDDAEVPAWALEQMGDHCFEDVAEPVAPIATSVTPEEQEQPQKPARKPPASK